MSLNVKSIRVLLTGLILILPSVALAYKGDATGSLSVTSSPSTVANANDQRIYVRIINTGSNVVSCGTATASNGKPIAAADSFEWAYAELASKAFSCVSASGTTVVVEGVAKDCSGVDSNCTRAVFP